MMETNADLLMNLVNRTLTSEVQKRDLFRTPRSKGFRRRSVYRVQRIISHLEKSDHSVFRDALTTGRLSMARTSGP